MYRVTSRRGGDRCRVLGVPGPAAEGPHGQDEAEGEASRSSTTETV